MIFTDYNVNYFVYIILQKIIESCGSIQELFMLSEERIREYFNLPVADSSFALIPDDDDDDDESIADETLVTESQCSSAKRLIAALQLLRTYSGNYVLLNFCMWCTDILMQAFRIYHPVETRLKGAQFDIFTHEAQKCVSIPNY